MSNEAWRPPHRRGGAHHPEVPPRVEDEISEPGRSLAPLFAALAGWSGNLDRVEQARESYDARRRAGSRRA